MRSPARRYRAPVYLALLFSLVASLPPTVRADAREYFRSGQNAYDRGNYELAIEQWEKAYKLEKKPLILYDLSLAYERLGMLEKAIRALKLFQGSADPDDPVFAKASASLAALEQRLASTGVRITGGVEGARILIDGREWGLLPRPDPISVRPGSHDVVIRHKDYRDFVSNVVVPAGQVVEVSVQMKRGGGDAAEKTFFEEPGEARTQRATPGGQQGDEQPEFFAGQPSSPQPSRRGDPTVWYITSGGLAAGAIGAAVWTAERAGQLGDCEKTETYYCKNEETVRRERNLAALTTLVLGAGAIGALVYGLVLDSGGGANEKKEKTQQEARAVSCGPTLVGARCAMRF